MSGGGATQANLSTEVSSSFKSFMWGNDNVDWGALGSATDWSADTYADNPSVLRWLVDYGLSAATATSPYDGVAAYDVSTDIASLETEVANLKTYVTAVAPPTDFGTNFAAAKEDVEGCISAIQVDAIIAAAQSYVATATNTLLTNATAAVVASDMGTVATASLAAFAARQLTWHGTTVGRLAAGFRNINAVMGSAYVMALSVQESEYQDRIAAYDAELSVDLVKMAYSAYIDAFIKQLTIQVAANVDAQLKQEQELLAFTNEGVKVITAAASEKMRGLGAVTTAQSDASRLSIDSESAEAVRNLEYDIQDYTFDLQLFQQASNVMSAVNGSVIATTTKPSQFQTALSAGSAAAGTAALLGATLATGGLVGVGVGVAAYLAG
jgi:hypothetical protein